MIRGKLNARQSKLNHQPTNNEQRTTKTKKRCNERSVCEMIFADDPNIRIL